MFSAYVISSSSKLVTVAEVFMFDFQTTFIYNLILLPEVLNVSAKLAMNTPKFRRRGQLWTNPADGSVFVNDQEGPQVNRTCVLVHVTLIPCNTFLKLLLTITSNVNMWYL